MYTIQCTIWAAENILSRSGWLTYPSHIMPVQAFSIFIFSCLPERNIGVRIDQLLYPKYDLFALNHSIISPLCLVWVRVPLWAHVRQAKFCLRVCQVVFLGVLPFSPHILIGPSHMSWNNLERDVKLNKKIRSSSQYKRKHTCGLPSQTSIPLRFKNLM